MDELTSIVTSTLEARGVLNKIRAELRANVFSAIQEQQGAPDSAGWPGAPTWERAAHKLGAAIHCSSSFVRCLQSRFSPPLTLQAR